mgnify:CR=1 FL=1
MDKKFDVIIVGTGAAGLYAALNLPEDINALLVSKKELTLSNSSLAQGGVAAVLDTVHDSYSCILPIHLLQVNTRILLMR